MLIHHNGAGVRVRDAARFIAAFSSPGQRHGKRPKAANSRRLTTIIAQAKSGHAVVKPGRFATVFHYFSRPAENRVLKTFRQEQKFFARIFRRHFYEVARARGFPFCEVAFRVQHFSSAQKSFE